MSDLMSWIDEVEKEREENSAYFKLVEGDNRVQLLTHTAPFPQVWSQADKRYRPAEEGDKNVSIKGVCYILQDGVIKEAMLPYTVVKAIRELQTDPDYAFEGFPMPRLINIKAKGAGTKEVEYTVIPAPKETTVEKSILDELATKPSPDEVVDKKKSKAKPIDYPASAEETAF